MHQHSELTDIEKIGLEYKGIQRAAELSLEPLKNGKKDDRGGNAGTCSRLQDLHERGQPSQESGEGNRRRLVRYRASPRKTGLRLFRNTSVRT